MTDEQRIKELAAKLAEAEQRIADIQQRVCVAVEQRDEAIRQRDRGDICRMACKARDELEAKLVEAENLLRTDSDGNIRSVFYMEGQAEKAERERDELKAELEEAEKQRDDAQAFFEGQADKTADLQESLHVVKAKLAEVARERDEALAKLANASMEWMFGHATRLRSALRATTEGCLPDDKMEAQPAKLLARAELAERERNELKGQLARAETRERDLEMVNARVEADYAELERERDELKAKLAEAEKRNDTLLSHNKALANGLQNDGLWSQDHEELIRATRERDELKAALDKTREALELAESRLAYCVVPGLAECARDELKAKLSAAECLLGEVESGAIQVNDDLKRGREIEEESRKRLDTLEEIAAAVTELREAWNDMEACPDSGQGCPDSVLVRLLQWGCRPVCERLCTLEGLVDPYREEPAEGKS